MTQGVPLNSIPKPLKVLQKSMKPIGVGEQGSVTSVRVCQIAWYGCCAWCVQADRLLRGYYRVWELLCLPPHTAKVLLHIFHLPLLPVRLPGGDRQGLPDAERPPVLLFITGTLRWTIMISCRLCILYSIHGNGVEKAPCVSAIDDGRAWRLCYIFKTTYSLFLYILRSKILWNTSFVAAHDGRIRNLSESDPSPTALFGA